MRTFPVCLALILCQLLVISSFYVKIEEFRSILEGNGFGKKYLIVIIERLGLANRLRTLADWNLIATVSDRNLIVSWHRTIDCNVSLSDLFDALPPNVLALPTAITTQDVPSLLNAFPHPENPIHYYDGSSDDFWIQKRLGFIARKKNFLSNTPLVFASYDGSITLEDIPCQYYHQKHSQFLSKLLPKKHFLDAVDEIFNKFFDGFIPVGIHLRVNDPRFDWAVVPPLSGSDRENAREFGEGAKFEHFAIPMMELEKAFQFTIPVHPTPENNFTTNQTTTLVRFFIATNSIVEKKRFLEYFPSAITLFSDDRLLARETTEGMERAFLDWLLLSRTSLILNTYGSSFAAEAAHVYSVPIVGVYESYLIAYDSPYLQHCGIMQYAKFLQKKASPVTFTEGTFDNREVNLIMFLLYCGYVFILVEYRWMG